MCIFVTDCMWSIRSTFGFQPCGLFQCAFWSMSLSEGVANMPIDTTANFDVRAGHKRGGSNAFFISYINSSDMKYAPSHNPAQSI